MSGPPASSSWTILAVEVKWKSLSGVPLFVIPRTVTPQVPLSEFCRQEYWSGLPHPSPGDLPNSGIEPRSPTLQAGSLPSEPPGKPGSFQTSWLWFWYLIPIFWGFPGGSDCKDSTWNAGGPGSIPGSGRSLGERHGNPLQYSYLDNPMDRGVWGATVDGVVKSHMETNTHTVILWMLPVFL